MKLFTVLLLATADANRGEKLFRKIQQRNGEVATAGKVIVNKNLLSSNARGFGCQLVEVNDDFLMGISGRNLRGFTSCGRCAEIACVGQYCPRDSRGSPKRIIAKVVSQATTTSEDNDVEINDAAWQGLMAAKADSVESMPIAWKFVPCPEERRAKLHLTDNNKSDYFELQPIDVPEKIIWMRVKNVGKGNKFIKANDPFRGNANSFVWGGKHSPKVVLSAPVEVYIQYESGKRTRAKVQDWEVGKFAYLDGKPAPAGEKAKQMVTESKGIMEQMASVFGGKKPAKTPAKRPSARPSSGSSVGAFGSSKKPSGGGMFGGSFSSVFGGASPTKATTTRTTRSTTTRRAPKKLPTRKPITTTRRTPKKGKGGGKGGGGKPLHCPPGKKTKRCLEKNKAKVQFDTNPFNPFEDPSPVNDRVMGGASGAQFDSWIQGILAPVLITEKPKPTTTTTTQEPTTKKTAIGGSFQTLTGLGAPSSVNGGVCQVTPVSNTIYAAINSNIGSQSDCGRCMFVYCPTFVGCRGQPISKVQIVDVFEGNGDVALSQAAFKLGVGLPNTASNKAKLYQGVYSFVSC